MRDYALGTTFDVKFTTRQFSTGAPFTLAGTPVISAYPDNSTTEITAGITLTVDFDSRTGLNNVRVVATSGNGYASGSNYSLVITTGTVNAVSVVGEVVGEFSLEAQSPLRPTVAGRTADVSSGGEMGVDWANVGSPTTAVDLSGTTIKTTQKVDVETIKTNPVVNAGTITFPTTATLASTTNLTAGTIATVSGSVNGSVGSVTGAVGSVTGAVGSVTGAVGSVAGLTAANLDTTISSRMATYTQPAGFLAATFPASPAAVGSAMTLTAAYDFAKGTTAMAEAYAANGVAPTPAQCLYAIQQYLTMFAISGTSYAVKKLDGTTNAFIVTLNDATTPTAATRS